MIDRTSCKIAAAVVGAIFFAVAAVAPGRAGPVSGGGRVSGGAAAYARGDYVTAARRLQSLAMAGSARAQALLGFMYANGRGVPQHYVSAVEWYCRAAEQGDPTGQYLLGLMYDKGQGVQPDVVIAHKWLILAAAHAGRREREPYTRVRDAVASKMSLAQIALAQDLARAWVPKPERY
jgi:uncharacterized protein